MLSRRGLITSMGAFFAVAPAIVRATSLMPIKPWLEPLTEAKFGQLLASSVTITPEMARALLIGHMKALGHESYEPSRRMSWRVMHKFATDMRNGRWNNTFYQPITLTSSGIIADGLHRLRAVAEANCPMEANVYRVLDGSCEHYDLGHMRNTRA